MRVQLTITLDDTDRERIIRYWKSRFGENLRRKNGLANAADVRRFAGEALDIQWMAVAEEEAVDP